MADRFSMSQNNFINNKPPTEASEETNKKQGTELESCKNLSNNLETQPFCSCSNIRVMQLFHEMKQEFPNIPDDVVNQHVIENCHDRENCKSQLKNEKDSYILPVQSYPVQLLRILNEDSLSKKNTKPKCIQQSNEKEKTNHHHVPPSTPQGNNCGLLSNDYNNFPKNRTHNSSTCSQDSSEVIKDMHPGLCSIQITTYTTDQNQLLHEFDKDAKHLPIPPQRPTSLKLNQGSEYLNTGYHQEHPRHRVHSKKCAGSPSSLISSCHSRGSTAATPTSPHPVQKFVKTQSISTSIQSPTNFSDARKAEILVNVSLSPTSHRNRGGPTKRHQSTINVHPELPFTRNLEASGSNNKSYTSVNLVLRQPSSSPQSPIDITVGPNLTYSSSSYHARLGYQNNYHITVTDEGGVFSAFRIQPVSYTSPKVDNIEEECSSEVPDDSSPDLQNSISRTTNSSKKNDVRKIILRQHNQMEKLSAVLRKNKNKLGLIRKEIDFVTQMVSTDGVSESLDSEIEKLRFDCQAMLNEIDNLRTCGLNEDSIEQTNSIKNRQQLPFPKQKPLRLLPSSMSTNNQRSLTNDQSSSRQQSITYSDNNFDYEAGD